MEKEYKKGELTVGWNPDRCIHSAKCWHGLPEVFNPKRKPWVDLNAADKSAIIKQVQTCPSGALFLKDKNETKMDKPKVTLAKDGPILIQQDLIICNEQGEEEIKKGPTALCRCGASSKKPFCDGSHKKVNFTS
ncbi:(4Fe-4S)-binding protein [Luteibaculum oceani]|uniref:Iron-binding zinc finger CDGSH type domain-containing protein n=1 Tax=Luteibaculum oceani TaxID=1294296 RepID=A0A5C6VNJ7_9FLAO|nr:(4Fe-4S)-binding protein [Luteibaculum oceani]TXC85125.1 hypothetical protein FRX97_00445 [Luteibaculum oceani]